jgi:pimeloyl-ACP methyl ester carboxylesterase
VRLLILAVLAIGCGGRAHRVEPADPPRREDGGVDVTLTTADGVKLAATHWIGPTSNDRCVVLVHQLGSTRDEWAPLIAKLRGDYEILAFDVRGHGDSRRGPHGDLSYRDFAKKDWEGAVRDLEAADRWLRERGYRADDCVYVGSSIGSSLVVRFAGEHPETGGLVLLSPGLAYRHVAIEEAAAKFAHPVLALFSGEPGTKDTMSAFERIWGKSLQMLEVDSTAHGVSLISDDEARLDLVVAFIKEAVPSDAAGSPSP